MNERSFVIVDAEDNTIAGHGVETWWLAVLAAYCALDTGTFDGVNILVDGGGERWLLGHLARNGELTLTYRGQRFVRFHIDEMNPPQPRRLVH